MVSVPRGTDDSPPDTKPRRVQREWVAAQGALTVPPPIQDMGTEDGHTEDQMWHLEFKSIWFLYLQEVTIPWVIAAQDCPLAIGEPSSWRDTLWLEGADVSLSLCLGGS
jgi:hypothetical protein